MAQGKKLNKEEVILALKPYFELGYSRNRACVLAGFPPTTLQTWVDNDEELRIKIRAWRGAVSLEARKSIVKKIEQGNVGLSKWWLERIEHKAFGRRGKLELEGSDPLKPFYVALPPRVARTI